MYKSSVSLVCLAKLPTVCFTSFILRTLLWRMNDDDDE